MADKKYNIIESVGSGHQTIHDYEDIEKHHPTWKEDPTKRFYGEIDGKREEFVYSPDGRQMLSKDIILKVDGSSHVAVPSPVEGYVKRTDRWGMVEIYEQPNGKGHMVARVRHMEPVHIADGAHVAYGQPLGIQGGKNPNGKPFGTHTHIDIDVGYLDNFKQYLRDVNSGVIGIDQYPSKTPDMHHNGSQLEPVKESSLEVPDNFKPLYASADKQVRDLYAQAGIDFADGGQNTVGKVLYEAAKANLTEVEQMTVKNGQIHLAQKAPSGFGYTTVSFGAVEAANTDYSKSMDGLVALSNPQQVASLTPEQNKTIDEPAVKARSLV